MLTGRSLAVVPVTNNDPLDAVLLVVTGNIRNRTISAADRVLDLVGLAVLSIDGTDKHVVGDVVQMSTVLQPGTGHGDVVSSGLSEALDKNGEILEVLAIPDLEWLEKLETVGGRRDGNGNRLAVGRRSLVGILTWVVSANGETEANGLLQLEFLAVGVRQSIDQGIEIQGTGNGQSNNKIGRGDEGMGGGVGIVTACEVTVVRRDDGIGGALLYITAIPLA